MISSIHNTLIKHLVKLREDKKYRETQKRVCISGIKLVTELSASLLPLRLFYEEENGILPANEHYQVSHAVMKKITGLPSPEPIAAEFPLPQPSLLGDQGPLLVLNAIRDPGNLGTLLRTALAFDWKGVFLLPSCVDLFNDKVIRSSRGASFQLPWTIGSWEELSEIKERGGFQCYIADTEGRDFSTLPAASTLLLLLSNEAQGVDPAAARFGEKITITMKGNMESLNVAIAGAILMYGLSHA